MTQEQQAGKRIVSKEEYTKVQARRFFGWFRVAYCFGSTLFLIGYVVMRWQDSHSAAKIYAASLLLFPAILMYIAGRFHMKQVRKIEHVVTLTRANTADLPAPDSLVRASEEPMQAQEAVLLRGSVGGQDGQEEHLLRASGGE